MELHDFQEIIRATYGERDRSRGLDATLGWFVEEVGELSRALRREGHDQQRIEVSDVLAWLVTLADLADVDVADAAARYAQGCPKCHSIPCGCPGPDDGRTDPE